MPLAGAKQHDKPPSQLQEWPLPWSSQSTLDYDSSTESVLEVAGKGSRIQTDGILRISTEKAGADGFLQSWTPLTGRTRYLTVSDPSQLLLQDLATSLSGIPLKISLSSDGNYAGIANLEQVQSRFNALLKPRFDRILDARGKPVPAGVRSGLKNVMAAYGAGPVLEMQLSVLPTAYNFMSNGGMGLDYEYRYEDTGANPLGGEPFPMAGRFTLRKDELRPGWLLLEWSTAVDREKGGPLLARLARTLLGEAFLADSGKRVQDQIARMADNIDIGTSSRFRIDPGTGIVQWMQLVQRRRVGDRNDVRTTTLALRPERYSGPAKGLVDEPASLLVEACTDPQDPADAVIAACTALLRTGSEDGSLAMIGYLNRGRAYDARSDYDSALRDFSAAIENDPSHSEAYLYRAVVHGKKEELESTLADIDKGIELSPGDGRMYLVRASAREHRKEYLLALRDYDRAVELVPRNAAAWGARCWARAIGGADLQSALDDCDRAIALDATSANANTFNSRGFVNFRLGRYPQSIRDYDSAIEGDPAVASSYYMRGLAKARNGDPSAPVDLAAGTRMEPEVAERYAGYGVVSDKEPEIRR
ncbi:MAG: tetratricopeptide repeat protein [Pseudoxanthomonas sp.]